MDENERSRIPSDRCARKNVWLATAISGVVVGCIYGTRPLVALQAQDWGASSFQIGLLTSAFSVLPAAVLLPLAARTRGVSLNRRLFFASFFSCAGLLLPQLTGNIAGLYLSQFVSGLAFAMFLVIAMAFIEANSTPRSRDLNVSRYMIATACGTFLGPALGGFLGERWGYAEAFAAIALCGMCTTGLSLLTTIQAREDSEVRTAPASTRRLLGKADLRQALYISALVLASKDMYVAYFPLFGESLGMSSTIIGLLISANALAGILIRWLLPPLIARNGAMTVLTGSFLLSGVLFAFIPLFHHAAYLAIISFLLGLGLGIGQPISVTATLASLPREDVPTGLSLRIMFNRVGQATAPFLFGAIAQLLGVASVFLCFGAVFILGAWKTSSSTGNHYREME